MGYRYGGRSVRPVRPPERQTTPAGAGNPITNCRAVPQPGGIHIDPRPMPHRGQPGRRSRASIAEARAIGRLSARSQERKGHRRETPRVSRRHLRSIDPSQGEERDPSPFCGRGLVLWCHPTQGESNDRLRFHLETTLATQGARVWFERFRRYSPRPKGFGREQTNCLPKKQRLRPTKQTLSLQVEKRFHLLAKGSANQNVDAWPTEWTDMYHEAKRMDIPEVSGDRAIRDFLLAVESVNPTYGNGRQEARNTIEDQNFGLGDRKLRQRTMDEEIERIRNRIRLQQNSSVIKTSRSAFATDIKPSLKGKDQQGKKAKSETPLCICGDKMHYADCPYLVPFKAPTGWKEDPIVRKTVNDALKDTKIQA